MGDKESSIQIILSSSIIQVIVVCYYYCYMCRFNQKRTSKIEWWTIKHLPQNYVEKSIQKNIIASFHYYNQYCQNLCGHFFCVNKYASTPS